MRDIALSLIIFGALPFVFRWPVLGALLWAWLGLMTPQKMTYGFAFDLPFSQVVAAVTLLAFLGARQRRRIPMNAVTALWLLMLAWMTLTSFFAINTRELVVERWVFVFKIHLMLAISLMLVTEVRHFKWLVWLVTLSVAFFGIKGGIFTITTGGGGRVWGPPGGLLQGNNELAVGLIMLVPYLYWMRETIASKWARHGLMAAMLLCVASILGSQSRGALLAIFAMAFMLALKSRHKLRTSLLVGVGLVVALVSMPESWTQRMDSIQEYEQDGSAMSRIWTWTTLWNTAVDRPLVGAGFRADNHAVFQRYAPQGGQWAQFEGTVFVAHSIYFQMLGEHGFVGLLLFIALWLAVWVLAGRTARQAQALPGLAAWLPLLMRMTQVSLVGYLAGGAFLSLAYLDLPFYLLGFVLLGVSFVREAQQRPATVPATEQAPGSAQALRAGPRAQPGR